MKKIVCAVTYQDGPASKLRLKLIPGALPTSWAMILYGVEVAERNGRVVKTICFHNQGEMNKKISTREEVVEHAKLFCGPWDGSIPRTFYYFTPRARAK